MGDVDQKQGLLKSPAAPQAAVTAQLILCVLVSVPGALQFGYNSGVINTPEAIIRSTLNIGQLGYSAMVAVFCIGGLTGTQLGGKIADALGRRPFLIWHSVGFIIGGILEALSRVLPAPLLFLIVARIIIGFASGGATVVVPMYLGEIAPQHLRGAFGSLCQFSVVIGVLIAQIAGILMDNDPGWCYLLAITAMLGALQIVLGITLLHESPKWYIMRGRVAEARKVFMAIRGYSEADCDAEVQIVQETAQSASTNTKAPSALQVLRDQRIRLQLIVAFVMHASQQLSGINAVFYYSTAFFASAGLSNPNVGTLLAGVVNLLATGVAVYMMERAGRRPLMIWGAVGMCICSIALTVALVIQRSHATATSGALAIVFVLGFVSFFEIGLGPIPWAIGGEIFPEEVRGTAMGVTASLNWFANFLVSIGFQSMAEALGAYSFVPFAVILFLCATFCYKYLVETKDRSLRQIADEFDRLAGRSNLPK